MISRTLRGTMMDGPGAGVGVDVDFVYLAEADPHAVHLRFVGPTNDVSWAFSRDLLLQGLVRDVGEGDVKVKSVDKFTFITLCPPGQSVGFSFKRELVKEFVESVYSAVPEQRVEEIISDVDFDRELAMFLKEE